MNQTPGMYETKGQAMRAGAWLLVLVVVDLVLAFGVMAAVAEVVKAVL